MKRPSSDANTSLIKVVISNNTSVAIDWLDSERIINSAAVDISTQHAKQQHKSTLGSYS
jgi:hypothetical protein